MKKWILKIAVVLVLSLAGLSLMPAPAVATFHPTRSAKVEIPAVATVRMPAPATDGDFSDADFTAQDQPELGTLSGGEVVVLVGGGLLLLVLLILLIIWLVH